MSGATFISPNDAFSEDRAVYEAWRAFIFQVFLLLITLRLIAYCWPPPFKRRAVIVLGSGGHTSEMIRFLQTMQSDIPNYIYPRHYLVATTDSGSASKAIALEDAMGGTLGQDYFIHRIPRSREVGQSYITSIVTTIWSLFWSSILLFKISPLLVITNGPGTCVPIIISAWVLKKIGWLNHCIISYSESYACVFRPSLTTRIVASMVDPLFVQWPKLKTIYRRAIYSGRIPIEGYGPPLRPITSQNNEKTYVFVTVGTTKFDELIKVIDSAAFVNVIKDLGYKGLHVQYGQGKRPSFLSSSRDFEVKLFDFLPSLNDEIKGSSLVIGHAGVGTIFEALELERNLIIVPNTALMNNHQQEIAKAMSKLNFCYLSSVTGLLGELPTLSFSKLRLFPKNETKVFGKTICDRIRMTRHPSW